MLKVEIKEKKTQFKNIPKVKNTIISLGMKFDKKKNLDDAIKENQFKKLSQIKKNSNQNNRD
jgi:hypothetical protein